MSDFRQQDWDYLHDIAQQQTGAPQPTDIPDVPAVELDKPPFMSERNYAEDAIGNLFNTEGDVDSGKNASSSGNTVAEQIKELSKIYGNNIFALEVEKTVIIGILSELPELTATTTWASNALVNIQEILTKKITNNTVLQLINSIMGAPQLPFVAGGATTTRKYTGVSGHSAFNLKFRIYSFEPIGPASGLSGYKRVLAALCMYAPALHTLDPASALKMSIYNVGNTLLSIMKLLNAGTEYAVNVFEGNNSVGISDEYLATFDKNDMNAAKTAVLNLKTDFDDLRKRDADVSAYITTIVKDLSVIIEKAEPLLNNKKRVLNDKNRVQSTLNFHDGFFGGALWNLTVLPGIFSHKFPIFVQSWTAKPSKEIDATGNAAYIDFTITCVMDQIKCGTWWSNCIYRAEGEEYKNTYKAQVKTAD